MSSPDNLADKAVVAKPGAVVASEGMDAVRLNQLLIANEALATAHAAAAVATADLEEREAQEAMVEPSSW